jgi:hypothetical protein
VADKLAIVCWKWKGQTMGKERPDYGALHVNRLASMVDRWLKMPHEIVCVTDDPEGIDSGIRIVELWPELRQHGRCYVRLKAFARDAAEFLAPRFVSLDLDTVVVGPLDPLFDRPDPFVIWSDPSQITPYCGSQWMLTAGAHAEVYEHFDAMRAATLRKKNGYLGSDQAWMAYMLPNAPVWTRPDGVYSFRMHLLKNRGAEWVGNRFKRWMRRKGIPRLPENARIIHFHGLYDPSQLYLHRSIPWIENNWI